MLKQSSGELIMVIKEVENSREYGLHRSPAIASMVSSEGDLGRDGFEISRYSDKRLEGQVNHRVTTHDTTSHDNPILV
jgi:hypothetical protein